MAVRTATDSCWSKRLCTVLVVVPSRWAAALARCFNTAEASVAHAPVDSHTMGRKVTPASEQAAAVFKWARLVSEYEEAACRATFEAVPTKAG